MWTKGNAISRLKRRAPDVGRCHFEMVQLHKEGMEYLQAIQLKMMNTVERVSALVFSCLFLVFSFESAKDLWTKMP